MVHFPNGKHTVFYIIDSQTMVRDNSYKGQLNTIDTVK